MLLWVMSIIASLLFTQSLLAEAVETHPWKVVDNQDAMWNRFPNLHLGTIDWRTIALLLYSNPRLVIESIENLNLSQEQQNIFDKLESSILSLEALVVLYETSRISELIQSLQPYSSLMTVDQRIRFLACSGTYLAIIGQPDQGTERLKEAIRLARLDNNSQQLTNRLNDLAWVYLNMSKVEDAMTAVIEAETITRKTKATYEHAYSLMTLAGVHSAASRVQQSLDFSEEALKILKSLQYNYTVSMVLFNVMNTYSRQKNFAEAIRVSEELIPLVNQLKDESTLAYIHITLGRAWRAAEDIEKAIYFYESALPVVRNAHDIAAFTATVDSLVPLYLGLKRFDDSQALLKEYEDMIAKAYGDTPPHSIRTNSMRLRAQLQFTSGDQAQAYHTLKNLTESMSVTIRELEGRSIGSMGSEVELDLRNKQNEALKALAASQSESISALRRVRDLFAIVIGLSALLVYSMYRSHRKNALIREQKRNIDIILANIEEGILRFGPDFHITSEHSRSAANILHQGQDLTDLNLIKLLQNLESSTSEPTSHRIASTCQAVWGENRLSWDLNEGNLPTRLILRDREYKLSWQPLFIDSRLTAVVLVLSDITELMMSQKKQEESYEKTSFLINLIARVGHNLPKVLDQAAALKEFLSRNRVSLDQGDRSHLPRLHSFKGNLRTLSMSPLDIRVHDLESSLKDSKQLTQSLASLEQDLDKYLEISSYFESQTHCREHALLLSLNDIMKSVSKRLIEHDIVLDEVRIHFNISDLIPSHLECMESFFLHGLNNALDHGFVLPKKRGTLKEKRAARFLLSIRQSAGDLTFALCDNGVGIQLELIEQRCRERGIDPKSLDDLPSALFLPEFSTATEVSLTSGRGVGLSALKELATAHRGQVRISNRTDGPGTVLHMQLPTQNTDSKAS